VIGETFGVNRAFNAEVFVARGGAMSKVSDEMKSIANSKLKNAN
jgi:hypothetical protein